VSRVTAQHAVFHDYAFIADGDCATFGNDLCTMHDAAMLADGDITANGRIGCDIGGRGNMWRFVLVIDDHGLLQALCDAEFGMTHSAHRPSVIVRLSSRPGKPDNQVTHFFRPVEREEMAAALDYRHLGVLYQHAIVLAL